MQCHLCRFDNPETVNFCGQCGQSLKILCTSCNAANPANFEFCGACGSALSTTSLRTPSRPPDMEHRQLTVLFCDLADYTHMSERLDPEDLREIVRMYQNACETVVSKFEGHIAQFLGDGILVYFGYPRAHEDDADRALYAALDIVDAIDRLNVDDFVSRHGGRLSIRIGIHTGAVVTDELAFGVTVNIASRLQDLAEPNTIVFSDATHRLTRNRFATRSLGAHTLKGLTDPVTVFQLTAKQNESPLEASVNETLPLIGRDRELDTLLCAIDAARRGMGHVTLLSGEAGLGKSRLLLEMLNRSSDDGMVALVAGCSPHYRNTALHPLVGLLNRYFCLGETDTPGDKLDKLVAHLNQFDMATPQTVHLISAVLDIPLDPAEYPPLGVAPQEYKRRTFQTLLSLLERVSRRHPTVFVVEDLHWVDPSTLAFLSAVISEKLYEHMVCIFSFRPSFAHPWDQVANLRDVALTRLEKASVGTLVSHLARQKAVPTEVVERIVEQTDGVPIFIEEFTKMALESDFLEEADDRFVLKGALPVHAVPSTLSASLMARLDRHPDAKRVAQFAAVIGRSFSYEMLDSMFAEAQNLELQLAQLVVANILVQQGYPPSAKYTFKHALLQEAAYQSLVRSIRQQYHKKIAARLEQRFAEPADTQPELIAPHFIGANQPDKAIHYLILAGQKATQASANIEAIAHLEKGIELLSALPDDDTRKRYELNLQLALAPPLTATRGYVAKEVEGGYLRLLELCEQVGKPQELFLGMWGMAAYRFIKAELHESRPQLDQLIALSQAVPDPVLSLVAHYARGINLYFAGDDFNIAHDHLKRAAAFDAALREHPIDSPTGEDPGVAARAFTALASWLVGRPDEALTEATDAVAMARRLKQPQGVVFASIFKGALHHMRGEREALTAQIDQGVTLAREKGFVNLLPLAEFLKSASCSLTCHPDAERAGIEAAIAAMEGALGMWRMPGASIWQTYLLALLAEHHLLLKEPAKVLSLLDEAEAAIGRTHERVWEAEIHRLRGEAHLCRGSSAEHHARAERCFASAERIADDQQALSLVLRAVCSQAKLLKLQGQLPVAKARVAAVLERFDEGEDTADLIRAKAML